MLWKPNTVVAAVLERDGRFLFVEEMANGAAVFNQPAGHLDPGETLPDAVRRETLEETGWRMEPEGLVGVYLFEPPGQTITYLRFCFHGRVVGHDADRALDREILRAVWLAPAEIAALAARHRSPLVQRCLDDYRAGCRYPLSLLNDLRFPA